MLSHSVRRNLPKLLAAPQSGLFLLRLVLGGSGGLPERTARLSTRHELRDLPCPMRGGYFLATLFPMRFPIAFLGRWRALSRCDGWRFQTHILLTRRGSGSAKRLMQLTSDGGPLPRKSDWEAHGKQGSRKIVRNPPSRVRRDTRTAPGISILGSSACLAGWPDHPRWQLTKNGSRPSAPTRPGQPGGFLVPTLPVTFHPTKP